MSAGAVTRMLRLLEKERALLIAGDVEAASGLLTAKEKLADRLEAARIDADDALRLRTEATRNGELIMAARRGIEAAQERLRNLRRGVGVNTYSATGTRHMIERTAGNLQKRA